MARKNKNKILIISAVLGLIYLFLSFLVNRDYFHNLDFDVLTKFQSVFSRNVDLPFSVLTLFGSSELILTILAGIFIFLYWRRKYIFTGIFLVFLVYFLELAGKILIYHPKPPVLFNRYVLHFFLPSSFIVETNYSYPSGHMARVSFLGVIILYFLLSILKNKFHKIFYSIITVIIIILVFVSRIYLGEHWLSDVLGGLLLGSSLATLAIGFW